MDNWILFVNGEFVAVIGEEGIDPLMDDIGSLSADYYEMCALINPKTPFLMDNVFS